MRLLSISQSINKAFLPLFNLLPSVFILSFSFCAPPPKFFRAKPKQAGKKEGGLGEGIFARLRPAKRDWGGKRLIFASAKKKSPQKLFPFRRIFCARSLKELRIFAGFACRRQAASRWAGFAPVRAQTVARKKFEPRSAIATIQDFLNFLTQRIARSPRQRRGSLRKFPYISGLNQRGGQNQNGFFCPAFGGSWRRSHLSKNISLKESLKCFCFPIFSASCRRQENKASFNPALSAPSAQWPKAILLT